jgi:alpha-galactosidase
VIVDPRFVLSIEEREGGKALVFRAASKVETREPMTVLASASFDELAGLAGIGPSERAAFLDRSARLFFSNGWQSWSYGGELAARERIRRSLLIRGFNAETAHPVRREKKGEVLSHFLAWVRAGDKRLLLASRNSPERALPPLSFSVGRRKLGLKMEVYAEGGRFASGELIAEVVVAYVKGYFEAKDFLRNCFREYRHFERLAFLGHEGSLVPGGYESWYNHYAEIDDGIISRDLEAIASNANLINTYYLQRGKPTVFQIDDGWEVAIGDWRVDAAKFPRGMAVLAAEIEGRGMVPGLWIAPFVVERRSAVFRERPEWLLRDSSGKNVVAGWNPAWGKEFFCLDLSIPAVEDYLAGIFDTIIEGWGYRYLKLDFVYAGLLRGLRKGGGAAYEHYELVLRRITSRIANSRGSPLAYLGCGAPFEPSFRHFPLMRIGTDTKEAWDWPILKAIRHQGRPSAYVSAVDTIGRSILDGTVFVSDPDVVFCRSSAMLLSESEKELVALVDFMLASQIMFSDDTHEFGEASEAAFTKWIVALYDRLAGREYGAERIARDVYSLFSRDGRIRGVANLSNKAWAAAGYDPARSIVLHALALGSKGKLAFEPRSISLFQE